MTELNPSESELVALGAAMGSNCIPCIEYHIPKSREAGLTDRQISAAIALADKVRKVPARKVLEAANKMLDASPAGARSDDTDAGCGEAATPDTSPATSGEESCCA